MSDILANVVHVEILRNLRDGDIVWVTAGEGIESDEIDAIESVLGSVMPDGVGLFVTQRGYLDSIRNVSLYELLRLRQMIEDAIDSHAENRAIDEEA